MCTSKSKTRHCAKWQKRLCSNKARKICSIKLLLIMGFALQAAIPICIIIIVTIVKQQQTIMAHSKDIADLMRRRVHHNVNTFIDSVIREASQVWFHNQHQTFDPYNLTQAQRLLYPSIKHTNISAIYYTRIDRDEFVGYGRYCNCGDKSIHFTYAIDQKFYDQPIDDTETGYTLPNYQPLVNFSLAEEDWHARALQNDGPAFTEPYYVGNTKYSAEPTVWISCTIPITSPSNSSKIIGILGADYMLSSVNNFLQGLQMSPNSAVYIVESRKGYMIAGSRNEQVYKIEKGKLIRLPLSQSQDSIIGYIGAQLEREYGTNFSNVRSQVFSIDNYTMLVDPIQFNKLNTQWTVLVMVSVSDYMGPANLLQQVIFIVDVVILVMSILCGLGFACLITHPLYNLTTRLRKNKFFVANKYRSPGTKPDRGCSMLYEVSTLQTNFAKMENAVNGFMKYVPREIVLNFINHPTQQKFFQPGVEPADIAIMFTDIEDFTAISERLQPDILIKIMTEYLEAVSNSIREHGGTLDKYIGDAVMALFNCPEKLDDYVTKACFCALAVRDATAKLNLANEMIGLPAFKTRIGIHTGSCLVGNIGSSYRLSYTAIGDAVNLASRIESLNKHYGSYLLISEDCYKVVKDQILCRELDKVSVKGRTQGVKVYEMINLMQTASVHEMEFANAYNSIMQLYFDQKFAAALWEVVKFERRYPFDKAACKLKKRLPDLIQEPPPASWDGSTVMHEK